MPGVSCVTLEMKMLKTPVRFWGEAPLRLPWTGPELQEALVCRGVNLKWGCLPSIHVQGFPCGSASKESACNAGDLGSIPGSGRSPGGHPRPLSLLQRGLAPRSKGTIPFAKGSS